MIARLSRFVLLLMLVAMAIRGVIPAGYMPDAGHQGRLFQITICTINGPQSVTLDDRMHPVDHPAQKQAHKSGCAFGLLNHLAFGEMPGAAFLVVPYPVAQDQQIVSRDVRISFSELFRIAQPRGPPVIV